MCRRYRHDVERRECQCGDEGAGSTRGEGAEDVAGRHQCGALPEPFRAGEPEYLDGRAEPDRRSLDRFHRPDVVFRECAGRADRRLSDPAGNAVRLYHDAPVRGVGQLDESWGDRLRYRGGRLDRDCRGDPGPSLHPEAGGTYTVGRRDGGRGRSWCWRCRAQRHLCRLDYPDRILPDPDVVGDRRQIFHTDGEDAGLLYHRGARPFVDLCADDGIPFPEAYFREADFCRPFLRGSE